MSGAMGSEQRVAPDPMPLGERLGRWADDIERIARREGFLHKASTPDGVFADPGRGLMDQICLLRDASAALHASERECERLRDEVEKRAHESASIAATSAANSIFRSRCAPMGSEQRYSEADVLRAFRRGQIQMRLRCWKQFRKTEFAHWPDFKTWASWPRLPNDPKWRIDGE